MARLLRAYRLAKAQWCLFLKLSALRIPTFVTETPQDVRMLLVLCQMCLPNTDLDATFFAGHDSTTMLRAQREFRDRHSDAFVRKSATRVGSKTCNGLTYLKLALLNVQRLLLVSGVQHVILRNNIPSWRS
jgi:hypothetical protein